MSLRDRKKQRTRTAIHHAAMQLFAQRGYAATTVGDIAEAADVSRATFFSYYASKDEVVFGEAPAALEALEALLEPIGEPDAVLAAVRAWLGSLAGWLDDEELPLQHRIAAEVPSVAAHRLLLGRRIEDVIAAALQRGLAGADAELTARLAAAALVAAIGTAEELAARRTAQTGMVLSRDELDALLDHSLALAHGGLEALRSR